MYVFENRICLLLFFGFDQKNYLVGALYPDSILFFFIYPNPFFPFLPPKLILLFMVIFTRGTEQFFSVVLLFHWILSTYILHIHEKYGQIGFERIPPLGVSNLNIWRLVNVENWSNYHLNRTALEHFYNHCYL